MIRDKLIALGLWRISGNAGGTNAGPTPLGWAVLAAAIGGVVYIAHRKGVL